MTDNQDNLTPTSRETLTENFADNQTPTGAQFKELIDSALIKGDDPIDIALAPEGQQVVIAASLVVDGTTTVNQRTTLKGALVAEDTVNVNGATTLNGDVTVSSEAGEELTLTDKTLTGNADAPWLQVTGDSALVGTLAVTGNTELNAELTVAGNMISKKSLEVGSNNSAGSIALKHQGDRATLVVDKVTGTEGDYHTHTQLSLDSDGRLSLGLNASQAGAQLHLSHNHSDGGAIFRADATADDPSPFIINGDGLVGVATEDPKNALDVAGSVYIGTSSGAIAQHNNNTLAVENKIGIGTIAPAARLDVHADTNDIALNVQYGEHVDLTVEKGLVKTGENTSLYVGGTTTIEGQATVAGLVTIGGSATVDGATELKQALTVTGPATFNNEVIVDAAFSVNQPATFVQSADITGALGVTGHTTVTTVTASDNATLQKQLVVQGDAKYAKSVAIGLGTDDNHNASAALHIKEGSHTPGFRLDDVTGEKILLVNAKNIDMGTTNTPVELTVKGDASISKELTAEGLSRLKGGAIVKQQLKVQQSADDTDTVALNVKGVGSTGIKISHQDENDNLKTILTTHNNKVGVLCDAPERDLHVAGDMQIDKNALMKAQLDVTGELLAHGNVTLDATMTVGSAQDSAPSARVYIAPPVEGASLIVAGSTVDKPTLNIKDGAIGIHTIEPRCALDIAGDVIISGSENNSLSDGESLPALAVTGDVNIVGATSFNDFMTVSDSRVLLKNSEGAVALTIQGDSQTPGVQLDANSIKINIPDTAAPSSANLHVKGSVELEGQTTADNITVKNTLRVNKSSELQGDVKVSGPISINNHLTQENLQDPQVDLHLRQSTINKTALKVDPVVGDSSAFIVKPGANGAQVGINTNSPLHALDIMGDLGVSSHVTIDETLTVAGKTTLNNTAYINANMAFGVTEPQAMLHINASDNSEDTTALRIDSRINETDSPLLFKQGMLGVGCHNPIKTLDVKGDAQVSDELIVHGQTKLEHTLYVDKDALFKSDFTVNKDTELVGQTVMGQSNEIDPTLTPSAQLYIADTRYKEALRIDSVDYPSLVFSRGKLGLGLDNADPRVALDVAGEFRLSMKAELEAELEVDGIITARNNIEGSGTLHIAQKATFGSDTLVKGDLHVEDHTVIDEELTVAGDTELKASLTVARNTALAQQLDVTGTINAMSELNVSKTLSVTGAATVGGLFSVNNSAVIDNNMTVKQNLYVHGAIHSGVENAQAYLHLQSPEQQAAFILDQQNSRGDIRRLVTVDEMGQLGIGVVQPGAALDVEGHAQVSGHLKSQSATVDMMLSARDLSLSNSLSLGQGPKIVSISTDKNLGGDASVDSTLATQAAVKAYVDHIAVPFARGGKTHIVSSQQDFDLVFNHNNHTSIAENTTIILLPMNHQGIGNYQLRNSVRLRSGVSIVGFNAATTRIIKANANARFELIGTPSHEIKQVALNGFTFDGKKLKTAKSGGAFYLEYVADCQLNCVIKNHISWANGGAICALLPSDGSYSATGIEALHISDCHVMDQGEGSDIQLNKGGAAYGLSDSRIHAVNCSAERGGAVAQCQDSIVEAYSCYASRSGGAAYRSTRLRLLAKDCHTDLLQGKGGGAYYCSDLICEGLWTGNNAGEAPHIYASNHLTDHSEERHYWKGDYIGRRLDEETRVWRSHNE